MSGTIILRPSVLTPQEARKRAVRRRSGPRARKHRRLAKELTEAGKTLAKARQALKENKTPEAQRELEHLVELEPGNASAWYELGRLYEQQGRRADASKSYTSAIAADATLVGPYAMLAGLQAQDQQWKELAETTDKLIRVNPVDVPQPISTRRSPTITWGIWTRRRRPRAREFKSIRSTGYRACTTC